MLRQERVEAENEDAEPLCREPRAFSAARKVFPEPAQPAIATRGLPREQVEDAVLLLGEP